MSNIMGFKKNDKDKTMFSLVEPDFIKGVAEILTEGAKTYGIENWKSLPESERRRYKDALLRHINTYMSDDIIDQDSGKHHLLHVACNCMFLHYFDKLDGKLD